MLGSRPGTDVDNTLILFGEGSRPRELRSCCPLCGVRLSGPGHVCFGQRGEGDEAGVAGPGKFAADPFIGTIVDHRYEVFSLLGEGGMGIVYQVRHTSLGRSRAMKVLRQELARDQVLSARFVQEAKAAAVVCHPSVVEIMDFGVLPTGQAYFVMELLVGRLLSDLIRQHGRIGADRAVGILRQTAQGLGAAHAAGVVHRDLKPDNIHVEESHGGDTVKVLDFGLAQIEGCKRLTRRGMVFGTPHYMSPEQAAGDPVDQRSDVYALGVVAYQMLTGRVPFDADTYMGVLSRHIYVPPMAPSAVLGHPIALPGLEALVLRCLAKRPEARFANMAAVVEGLDALLSHPRSQRRDGVDSGGLPAQALQTRSVVNLVPLLGLVMVAFVVGLVPLSFWWVHSHTRTSEPAQSSVRGAKGPAVGGHRRLGGQRGSLSAVTLPETSPSSTSLSAPEALSHAPILLGESPAVEKGPRRGASRVRPDGNLGGGGARGAQGGRSLVPPRGSSNEVPSSPSSSRRSGARDQDSGLLRKPLEYTESSSQVVDPWAR